MEDKQLANPEETEITFGERLTGYKELERQWYVAASMQAEKDRLEKKLAKLTKTYNALLDYLKDKPCRAFEAAELRPLRVTLDDEIRRLRPDLFEALARITPTGIGEIMMAHFSTDALKEYLRMAEPRLYEARRHVNVTDLEAALSKDEMRAADGILYKRTFSVSKKTRVILKHPEEYPELAEGDE